MVIFPVVCPWKQQKTVKEETVEWVGHTQMAAPLVNIAGEWRCGLHKVAKDQVNVSQRREGTTSNVLLTFWKQSCSGKPNMVAKIKLHLIHPLFMHVNNLVVLCWLVPRKSPIRSYSYQCTNPAGRPSPAPLLHTPLFFPPEGGGMQKKEWLPLFNDWTFLRWCNWTAGVSTRSGLIGHKSTFKPEPWETYKLLIC